MSDLRELTKLRRRRGVTRASITRLETRLNELEGLIQQPSNVEHARQLAAKLETLDAEFKLYHFQIVDLLDDEEQLEREQEALDNHDDHVLDLDVRFKRLCSLTTPTQSTDQCKLSARKLHHLGGCIVVVRDLIQALPENHEELHR